MNLEVLKKIKITSIFFFSTLVFIIISYAMYQTLDLNATSLKAESANLQSKLIKIKIKTKKNLKIANKAIDFINVHNNLYFINIKDEFDLIKFNKNIKDLFETFHPDSKFSSKGKLIKTKTNYYKYNFTYKWKYKNKYYLFVLFNKLNNNFFYSVDTLKYNTKNHTFKMVGSLYAKHNVKSILSEKSRRRNRRR